MSKWQKIIGIIAFAIIIVYELLIWANAYVDFAIEVAKELGLFESEEDLQETIGFWKYYNRVQ